MHHYVMEKRMDGADLAPGDREIEIIVNDTKGYRRDWGYEKMQRVPIPALPIDRRIGVAQVELGYTEEQAIEESSRCLHCWVNTIFEPHGEEVGTECILCGGCADICPEHCIELVVLDRIEADGPLLAKLEDEYEIVMRGEVGDLVGSVMIKDEDRCIRCGLCAMRCPVGCITMEEYAASVTCPV
jgi:ferredoxin